MIVAFAIIVAQRVATCKCSKFLMSQQLQKIKVWKFLCSCFCNQYSEQNQSLILNSNDMNNCKSGLGDNTYCTEQFDFFAAFGGSGNVCSGVEISATAVVS